MDNPKKLILDYSKMTHQEFYENYWLVDGKKPPPLTDADKSILAAFDNLQDGDRLFVSRGRGGVRKLYKCAEDKKLKSIELEVINKP